jgi:hypothetical protein
MGVDAHVASSSTETLPLTIRDVLLGLGIAVLLGHTEVNHMDNVRRFGSRTTNEEVVRFDIAVDEVAFVYRLDAREHLSSSHAYGLDGKLATAHIKEVFQTRTKEVNDEDVVQALLAKVVDLGDSRAVGEDAIGATFVSELGCFSFSRFEFDRDGLGVEEIRAFENDTE